MMKVVMTFLESYNFKGKTIVPFCTHGGSGLSNTESTIADITGGTMKDGFAIPGTTAQNDRNTARSEVTEWLKEGGFVEEYRTSGTGKMAFFLSRWFLCVVMFFMQVHST